MKKKIYVITNGKHIKVGISKNPLKRLKSLKTASPTPLKILMLFDGDQKLEKKIHKQLARFRTYGGGQEWFVNNKQVINILKCYSGCHEEMRLSNNKETLKKKMSREIKDPALRIKAVKRNECPVCRSNMVIRKNKLGDKFWGCSSFPKCKNTHPYITKDLKKCNSCKKGHMIKRAGPRGAFFGCSNFPKCRNTENI